MFHPTSLVPVEAIMTMIRAIKIDHGTDPEWSLFRIHIVLDLDGPLGGIEQEDPIGAYLRCINVIFVILGQFFPLL